MRKVILLLALFLTSVCNAQTDNVGKIALNPYVVDSEPLTQQQRDLLITKLNRIITANGCAGEGFDNRFVLTSHVQVLEERMLNTVPSNVALRVSMTFFVGDGFSNTLFSSYNMEIKGVGEDKQEAMTAAIRKVNVRDAGLMREIEAGKKKIEEYYIANANSIISKAKSSAQAGNYEEAISTLMAIPSVCPQYQEAQTLVGKYGEVYAERLNMNIISQARAAWSASADEAGAQKAQNLLSTLVAPSANVIKAANALSGEMAARMKAVSDREFQLRMQQEQDETKVKVATIKAAARVASEYYKAQQRVYYVHWW